MIFLDLIFPPLCNECKERCSTGALCPSCWQLSAPPDPVGRCRHCFQEIDEKNALCDQCKRQPHLYSARAYVFDWGAPVWHLRRDADAAMAGFALLQWVQLEWPWPDLVIPMPDSASKAIGSFLADFLERPLVAASRVHHHPEDLQFLLIDAGNPLSSLKKVETLLLEAFPKRIHLLSLSPYDPFDT